MRSVLLALVLLAAAGHASAQERESFDAACSFGDLAACNILGLMYETGSGVDQDLQRASAIYGKACDAGETSGCTSLGLLKAHGLGMLEDRQAAADLYRTACEADDDFGCDLLAALQWEGPITEPQHFFKRGRVGDAKTAVMLPQALVHVPALGVHALTDEQGRISLGRVEEGHYAVRAEALGYEPMGGTLIVPGYSEFVVLLQPLKWDNPRAPGRINGHVVDEAGVGIADVEVRVLDQERARVITNQEGWFFLREVAVGVVTLEFSRLGYATRETMLIVQPDGSAQIDAVLSTDAIELDAIDVTVKNRSAYLQRNGFYRRQQRGFGHQLTVDDFVAEGATIGELIRQVRGVRVEEDIFRRQFVFGTRASAQCHFDSYVDGIKTRDGNVNWATPSQVEGIEIYQGMDVPAEYSRGGNCGVVLIWTISP